MKTHCIFAVTAYLMRETTLAAASGGYASRVNKVHGGEAATIEERMDGIKIAAGDNRPKAAPAAAAANQVLASCSDDDSFSLSGFDDGSYDGCYAEITVSGDTWFSVDGEFEDGLYFFPLETTSGDLIWGRGTAVADTDTYTVVVDAGACLDGDFGDVATTHPTEVTEWTCGTTSSAVADTIGFVLECGCNSALSFLLPGGALATAFVALVGANFLLVW